MKKIVALAGAALLLAGCSTDAEVASQNISNDADNFKVDRRIVFINGITDEYLFTVEGKCSIQPDPAQQQLEVTCKTENEGFVKHFFGLGDNAVYLVQQLTESESTASRYKLTFKPSTIVPNVEVR